MPSRLRLSRAKGARLPAGAVSVARPSRWSNPFSVESYPWRGGLYQVYGEFDLVLDGLTREHAHRLAVDLFRHYAEATGLDVSELAGKDLACWCPEHLACHADVLIELANR